MATEEKQEHVPPSMQPEQQRLDKTNQRKHLMEYLIDLEANLDKTDAELHKFNTSISIEEYAEGRELRSARSIMIVLRGALRNALMNEWNEEQDA